MRLLLCCLLLSVCGVTPSSAEEEATFLLAAELADGDSSAVAVTLEVGGDWIDVFDIEETGTKKLPLTVTSELRYTEQLLT